MTVWREILAGETLVNLENDHEFVKFTPAKLLKSLMTKACIGHFIIPPRLMNIEQIDGIPLGTWPTTCSMWLISLFMATACGLQGLLFLVRKLIPLHQTG